MTTDKKDTPEATISPSRERFSKALGELVMSEMDRQDSSLHDILEQLSIEAAGLACAIIPLNFSDAAYQAQAIWVANEPSPEEIEEALADEEEAAAANEDYVCDDCLEKNKKSVAEVKPN